VEEVEEEVVIGIVSLKALQNLLKRWEFLYTFVKVRWSSNQYTPRYQNLMHRYISKTYNKWE